MVLHNVHLHGSFISRNGHATSLHLSSQLVPHTCKLAANFYAKRPLGIPAPPYMVPIPNYSFKSSEMIEEYEMRLQT